MLGCDLHCSYCQNWVTSQALRDPNAVSPPVLMTPEELVQEAVQQGAKVVVSTYNEPLITSEWAVAVFKEARAAGLSTGYVSNGNGTPQVLEYLRPWVDLYKVDLKSFDDRHYRQLGGRIQPILDTIRKLHEMGFWVEIVTLIVPGFNDSDDELKRMAEFLVSVSPDIPWHVTAFHQDYKMTEPGEYQPANAGASGRDRQGCGFALCLCRKPARPDRGAREHLLPQLPRAPCRTPRLPRPRLPAHRNGFLPRLRRCHPGALGGGFSRPDCRRSLPASIPEAVKSLQRLAPLKTAASCRIRGRTCESALRSSLKSRHERTSGLVLKATPRQSATDPPRRENSSIPSH